MSETSNVVRGVLRPDGTLELAERPNLPAGEVEVTIRAVAQVVTGENLAEYVQRIRAEREAAGYPFRSKKEIDAELESDRDWGEDRFDELRLHAESERTSPLAGPSVRP